MRSRLCLLIIGAIAAAEPAPTLAGIPISYTLPSDGSPAKSWRVTLAIVDPKNTD